MAVSLATQVSWIFWRGSDAINTAAFEEYCKLNAPVEGVFDGALIVIMDELYGRLKDKVWTPILDPVIQQNFWKYCGDDDCSKGKKKKQKDGSRGRRIQQGMS